MMERLIVGDETVPSLPRHVRLRKDEGRGRWVILAPERVLMPDEIAIEILQRCDGKASVSDIVAALAEDFNAPKEEIRQDVVAILQDLADKGFLDG